VTITLANTGKRYNREWIFRSVNYQFTAANACAIMGANGSGKSTFLQLIAGNYLCSEGNITYTLKGKTVAQEEIYRHLSYAAPYLELPEELTLAELLHFHTPFKPLLAGIDHQAFATICELGLSGKPLKHYSSGMKQRVKLALALLCDTSLVLLDEPVSNLDKKSIAWYRNLVETYRGERLFLVCSNQVQEEYFFCTQQLSIEDYKQLS
jgi:ABC-type multidrug transport system ATPase subunit